MECCVNLQGRKLVREYNIDIRSEENWKGNGTISVFWQIYSGRETNDKKTAHIGNY